MDAQSDSAASAGGNNDAQSDEARDASKSGDVGAAADANGAEGASDALDASEDALDASEDSPDASEEASSDHAMEANVPMGDAGDGGETGIVDGWGTTSAEREFTVTSPWDDWFPYVCYRALAGPGTEQAQLDFWQHTRRLVESSWSRIFYLTLQGWQPCSDAAPVAFEVTLTSSQPSSVDGVGEPGPGVGKPDGGKGRQIVLNLAASDAEVLYFFGRALGFGHEFGRQAYTGPCRPCQTDDQCTTGDRTTCLHSGYCGNLADHQSIMVAPDCGGGFEPTQKLSPWDIFAAQRAYRRKTPSTIVDRAGRCFAVAGGAIGSPIILWPGGVSSDQNFLRRFGQNASEADLLVSKDQNNDDACPGISFTASATAGTPLYAYACDPTSLAQDFQFPSVLLRAMGNMCVVAETASPGAGLELRQCGASSPDLERWSLRERQLALAAAELCVAVPAAPARGARLELQPCDSSVAAQHFDLASEKITFTDGAGAMTCFTVAGALPNEGSAVILWDTCANAPDNVVFYATGPILASGQCVDVLGGDSDADVPVEVLPCVNGKPSQEWDYHW